MSARERLRLIALVVTLVVSTGACSGDDDDGDAVAETPTTEIPTAEITTSPPAAAGDGDSAGSGDDCRGEARCTPANQPDVNQDGAVKIGVLHPDADATAFVAPAQAFAAERDWELVVEASVDPGRVREAARALCAEGVDMVALAAGELADAIPVAQEDECDGTVWYVAGGAVVGQTPYFFQADYDEDAVQRAVGVATGEIMDAEGIATAGFVAGDELDFSVDAFDAWTAGITSVVPDAETLAVYTGDFDDAALAERAAQTLLDQGAGIVYPYLRGGTDAVVERVSASDVLAIAPGTDQCGDERFAISAIYSRGNLFAAALAAFEAGDVSLGVTRTLRLGVDAAPAVTTCQP